MIKRIAALLLLGSLSLLAQDQERGIPIEKLMPAISKLPETVELKLDLIVQRRATLQARSDWLDTEKTLLTLEIQRHNETIDRLQAELSAQFKCDFDLDRRQCKPKEQKHGTGTIPEAAR